MAGVAAGCGSSSSSSSASGSGGKKKVTGVAFFGFAAANSFAQATWSGIQSVTKPANINAKFFDPNFSPQTQVSQIEDAITAGGYQVFVIQANDGNSVVPAVERAIKKGITVVGEFTPIGSNYASITPPVPGLIFVGEAPVANGHSLGRLAIEACGSVNPCQVAYLQGDTALPLDVARTKAVLETLKTAPNVKLVADPQGGYTQADGLKAAQDVLSANPNVNVIMGSSQAIEGAELAVKKAGKLGKIKLIGNGGSCQAVKGVLDGNWFASYIIAERSSGAKAAQLGISAAEGQSVPHSFNTEQLQNPLGTKSVIEKSGFKAQYCD
ncbi:MAG: sugar ABC transporter substrate-binding protein [Candidatus Dormiibacterota bacterium]